MENQKTINKIYTSLFYWGSQRLVFCFDFKKQNKIFNYSTIKSLLSIDFIGYRKVFFCLIMNFLLMNNKNCL